MRPVCQVCPHHCRLEEGALGLCRARKNVSGKIQSENYGRITGLALDPIEKKPLYRFYPGSSILSVGSYGCNLKCPFCQNHEISMCGEKEVFWERVSPEELAGQALEYASDAAHIRGAGQSRGAAGNIGVAFTYNEPCIGYEYVRDTARLVRRAGMKNVLVTNGCVELWVLEELLPYIDAMNIDLKGFTEEFYRKLGGDLETVKRFIVKAVAACHVELTTLIVPGENDGSQLRELIDWVAALDRNIPMHFSRFFPCFRMYDKEPTPVSQVYETVELAKKQLRYVYPGNC